VLDYLFRPSFGAALHILKIEIGGDSLSTDGAEPSHMHTEFEIPNFDRGYEYWIAKQAKQRNPTVRLYGLPWEWPRWVGSGTSNPYQNISKTTGYVLEWMKGAESVHKLGIDYIGVWNEQTCNPDYVVALRKALDHAGFNSTKIVAPDGSIKTTKVFLEKILASPALAAAVHAIGYHYPNSDPGVSAAEQARLGLPLWASEDDSTVDPPASAPPTSHPRKHPGGGCLARTINQNFVQGNITATIVWNAVMARYPQLRWDYTGLVAATDPFGGHYDVLPPVWAAAHTTQFTAPGWRLLRVGNGSGWLSRGGTYVSYVGPNGDLTIVVEKMDAVESPCMRGGRPEAEIGVTKAERATFHLGRMEGVASGISSLAVWRSHFGGNSESNSSNLFVQQPDVHVVDEKVEVALLPNWVYTFSTVRSAHKGEASPPSLAQFPAIYSDDFDSCTLSSIPKHIAPMAGAFDCVVASGGRAGQSLRQASPAKAICDRGDVMPYAIVGDGFRTTYNVSVDVLLPDDGSGGAFVGARAKGPVGADTGMDGIFLAMNATSWYVALRIVDLDSNSAPRAGHATGTVAESNATGTVAGSVTGDHTLSGTSSSILPVILAAGVLPPRLGGSMWRRLSLTTVGTTATAALDGVVVAAALTIPAPYDHFTSEVAGHKVNLGKGGYAAFGTVGYAIVEFDKLRVESSA
jgi:galactosylceramidase